MDRKAPAATVLVTAIVAITTLGAFALHNGIDGVLFLSVVGTIGLIAGVKVRDFWDGRGR